MWRSIGKARSRLKRGTVSILAGALVAVTLPLSACGTDTGGDIGAAVAVSPPVPVAIGACAGDYLFCDDFEGGRIDTAKWTIGNTDIAHQHPVRPQNVSIASYDDNGKIIGVADTVMFGDRHAGARRQGGVLITRASYGGGRYEARMKPLPGPNGCSCLWNYYDSDNEARPPAVRVYTEIDIEMPAHVATPPAWDIWKRTLGLNTWSHTDADSDATYLTPVLAIDPFDGQFHVFRWDWRDGANGELRIDWYVDDMLQGSTTQHVGSHPAQLWAGVWPAPWPGMDYGFDTAHLYIDWVRISRLPQM